MGITLFSSGKQLVVMFPGSQLYLNLVTLGRGDLKSPFHSVFNYWKLKSIARQFESELKKCEAEAHKV